MKFNVLHTRPKHRKWLFTILVELCRIENGIEAEDAMSSYTGMYCYDSEDAYSRLMSIFASKHGLSFKDAVNELGDVYGVGNIAKLLGYAAHILPSRFISYIYEMSEADMKNLPPF